MNTELNDNRTRQKAWHSKLLEQLPKVKNKIKTVTQRSKLLDYIKNILCWCCVVLTGWAYLLRCTLGEPSVSGLFSSSASAGWLFALIVAYSHCLLILFVFIICPACTVWTINTHQLLFSCITPRKIDEFEQKFQPVYLSKCWPFASTNNLSIC